MTTFQIIQNLDQASTVCCMKGFARGIDYTQNILICEVFWKYLNPQITHVYWDGDDFAEDSYTLILYEMMKRMPKVKFVACKKRSEIEAFKANWNGRCQNIGIYPMPDDVKWDEMGIMFYQQIRNVSSMVEVYCLGGGETLSKELASARKSTSRKKMWFIFKFTRKSKDGKLENVFEVKNKPNRLVLVI